MGFPSWAVAWRDLLLSLVLDAPLEPPVLHGEPRIEVIGAGLGRTGTLSLMEALDVLGYKSFHMASFFENSSNTRLWLDFAEGRASAKHLFGSLASQGYTATMDNPMCDVFEEQMRLYPEAKVVLTEHPNGAAGWAKSWLALLRTVHAQSTGFSMFYPNPLNFFPAFEDINHLRCMMGTRTMHLMPCTLIYKVDEQEEGWLEEQYEKHVSHVRATVPRDRLLEYKVTQGWGPLCEFLGKPVPELPFPQGNGSRFQGLMTFFIYFLVYAWIPCLMAPPCLSFWCCCWLCRRRCCVKHKMG